MSKKVLFLLDHPKPEYFYDNQPDYGKTPMGKNLKHDLTFIGLRENVNYVFWYTYPEIPKALSVDKRGNVKKYKVPKASEIKDTLETLKQVVDTYDPSVIVPMGSLGTNLLLKSNITKQQGVATRVDVFGKDRWVFPIFSQDYIETFPDHKTPRDLAIGLLGRFIKKGDSAFIPERPNYFEVKSIEQAREVFAKPIETGEYSWDTEVNTLSPDKKGAKVLVISFCWAEGHGCAIPVGHCERYSSTGTTITGDKSYFTKDDVAEIFDMLLNLSRAKIVGDIEPHIRTISNSPDTNPLYYKRLMKVGHNLTFDEHVLMSTGWAQVTDFVNNVDTKVGHFLEISQETGAGSTRKLSDLSFSLTSIGGYDKPLEEYKPWLIKTIKGYTDGKEKHRGVLGYLKDKIKETKDKNYQLNADDAKIIMAETQWDYLDTYNFNTPRVRDWVINKVAIPIVNRFRRASDIVATMNLEDIATSNNFNGDTFSYEWIPMDIMYYYASGDADASLRIHHALLDMMDANPLDQDGRVKNLYLNFYPQLVRTLANIEHTGIKVNNDYLTDLAKTYRDKVEELNKSLRKYDIVKDLEDERLSLYQQGVEEFKKAPKDRNAKIFKYRNKYKNNAYAFSASKDADIADILYKNLGYTLPYDPKYIKKGTWDKRKKESAITWEDYKTDKFSLKYVEKAAKEAKDIHTAQFVHDLIQFSMIEKISNSFTDSLRKFMDSNDLLHGHFNATGTGCVSGDTRVLTEDGWERIDSLSKNRQEGTFTPLAKKIYNGTNEESKAKFYYTGVKKGLKLLLSDGSSITVTRNHPVLKNIDIKKGDRLNKCNKVFTQHINNFVWEPAENLKIDDMLKMSIGQNRYGNNVSLPYRKDNYIYKNRNMKQPTLPRELTPELAEWLGMYMADGSYSTNNGSFKISLANHYVPVQERFKELTQRLFGITAKVIHAHNRVATVELSSIALGRWLVDLFDIHTRAIEKDIPEKIMQATKEVQEGFLKGLTLDSSTQKRKYPQITLASINETMMQKAKLILSNMGIFSTISRGKAYNDNCKYDHHDCFNLTMTFKESDKFISLIGLEEEFKITRYNQHKLNWKSQRHPKRQGIVTDDNTWLVSVTDIKEVNEMPFFDLNIPEGHSFYSNSIISHNTSRLSSNQINMQNIPSAKTDTHLYSYHHPVKRMFVSRFKDGKLLNIDYANLEFRVLGLITNEESMTEAFLTGKDIHKANAALAFGVSYDEVIKSERQAAKAIGFGLVYGQGARALAEKLGITLEESQAKIDAFFKSKPRVKRFIDDTHTFVEKNGYVTTLNGFRRNLSGAFSRDYGIRASADRQSVNTIIQGSGAILTNTSLIILNDALHAANLKSCIVATVHDSIVIDCPLDEVDKVANLALYIMKNLNYPWLFTEYKGKRIRYPIDAEVEIGNTYNDMVDYDEDIHKFKTLDDYIDYMGKLSRISDAKESGDITEEQYDTIMKALPIT